MKPPTPIDVGPASHTLPAARGAHRPRVVFVCANDFEQSPVNLGAASKVAALIRILVAKGFDIHYVDSSHQTRGWGHEQLGRTSNIDGTAVTLWRPFRLPSRKIGKVLNVLLAGRFFKRLKTVRPAFVWLYNSYAFEGALACRFLKDSQIPIVLELEDLPLARYRGLNPKPYWDQLYFGRLMSEAALVTFVNQGLLETYAGQVTRSMLLPAILHGGLGAAVDRRRFGAAPYTVGYFGGLDKEKGAAVMLDTVPKLPAQWRMVATGVGPLAARFAEAAKRFPRRLDFHGTVEQAQLHRLMRSCDVIVNPHQSIEAMHNGVFPFKVCEAIATGALLVSTPLPSIGEDMDRAVMTFDGSAAGLLDKLSKAARFHQINAGLIDALRVRVLAEYSEKFIGFRLGALLDEILHVAPAQEASS